MSFCNKTAHDYFEAAKKHKDSTESFIIRSFKLLQTSPHEITTGCSELGNLIKKRGNAVIWESYKLSAYIRLIPFREMLLVGSCSPEHDTGELIAAYLSKRFHNFVILIFTDQHHYIKTERVDIKEFPTFQEPNKEAIIANLRTFLDEKIEDCLDEQYLLSNSDDLWEVFYESQYLSQRQNIKLYRRDVPKYMYNKAGMLIEEKFYDKIANKTKRNKKLDNFLAGEK